MEGGGFGLGVGEGPQCVTLQHPGVGNGQSNPDPRCPAASQSMPQRACGTGPFNELPAACRKVRFCSDPRAVRLPLRFCSLLGESNQTLRRRGMAVKSGSEPWRRLARKRKTYAYI